MGMDKRMGEDEFDQKFEKYWREQVRGASGQRLEMLNRDLTGTKKLFENVLYPVLGTFDGLVLEYEIVSVSGVKIYIDTFHERLMTVFEEDHFITHAEKVTRERFSFERARARTAAILGYHYFPYSRDELERKQEFCQRNLLELIGSLGASGNAEFMRLSVYEREVLRYALLRTKPFRLSDVSACLQRKMELCRNIMQLLVERELVCLIGGSERRSHAFMITKRGIKLLHQR